ncbi:MAG: glycosyltransferase family 2 protein [Clostridia bacterium]|nr:glycosyltransferase family 2 protein [Clostridia bacterium]
MNYQQPDISVIVPCFNADRYLNVCLESLKAQKAPLIEMIFIDDGSTDATGAILDRFALEEPRAKVRHIPNGGVSAARNCGLSMATGRYIAFIDADDALEEQGLMILYQAAKRSDAQIISANHTVFDMEKNQRVKVEIDPVVQQPSEIVKEIIHMHRIYNNIWNKLYDRRLFDSGMKLDEGVRIGEDALLNLRLYMKAKKIVHLTDYTYVYRVHSKSAMATIKGYSEAHQPMLSSMSEIMLQQGIKERYFRDFLQSCIWRDEKEKGIRATMKRFNTHIRPLVLEGIREEEIPERDKNICRMVKMGVFPVFYVLMRVKEKVTGERWGIRR